jgi:hypothetical protein
MGNRANLGLKIDNDNTIVLYQHWAPEHLMRQYANALREAMPRWHDPYYGSRIVMSQIIGDDWKQEYGYGLTVNQISDNEHHVVIIDFTKQQVHLLEGEDVVKPTIKVSWTFSKFCDKYADSLVSA